MYVISRKISNELKDLISRMLCVDPKKRISLKQIREHKWYKSSKQLSCCGVIIGYETIPIDPEVLSEMSGLGYSSDNTKRYLENNIRNEITTAYWLLLKKKFKSGEPSIFDICNEKFDKKNLIPKISHINLKVKDSNKSNRHKSFDFSSLARDAEMSFRR